jgi:hypothetical protein
MTDKSEPDSVDPRAAIAALVESLRVAILGLTELFGQALAIQAQLERDTTDATSH